MEKYLTGGGLLNAAIVVLALAWAYNLIYTAISNARAAKKEAAAPIAALRNDLTALRNEIGCDRERITALERDLEHHADELRDLHQGQTEMCRGVQALLEHALHNGNTSEMEAASQSIGKWLRTR